nr:hypothetical protein [Mycoplasma haemocanis]
MVDNRTVWQESIFKGRKLFLFTETRKLKLGRRIKRSDVQIILVNIIYEYWGGDREYGTIYK